MDVGGIQNAINPLHTLFGVYDWTCFCACNALDYHCWMLKRAGVFWYFVALWRLSMSGAVLYTYKQELWPVLEATLASGGYITDIPIQQSRNGASAMVMRHGAISLLFLHRASSDLFDIEVWGDAPDA